MQDSKETRNRIWVTEQREKKNKEQICYLQAISFILIFIFIIIKITIKQFVIIGKLIHKPFLEI